MVVVVVVVVVVKEEEKTDLDSVPSTATQQLCDLI